jgi:riboflavin kinase/FMN adenylyltransferase
MAEVTGNGPDGGVANPAVDEASSGAGARLPALQPFPLDRVPAGLTGGAVAVGNFDGMHRGHAELIRRTLADARRNGGPAVVLTFEPHPRTVFRPEAPVFRLTPLPVKARVLKAMGVDGLAVAGFDRAFAAIAAEAFIETVLLGQLKLAAAVVGFNFHFGKGRAGTTALLVEAGKQHGFAVDVVDEVRYGEPIASSRIRDALAEGDVGVANELLGYRWFVLGQVERGDQRGRTLGYPTANLRLGPDCRLRHGVYAVRLQRADGRVLDGVASYGRRPTFDNGPPILETHIFDFAGDIYGEEVAVSLLGWIRPEEAFSSAEALIAAMNRDSRTARTMLASAGPGSALDRALVGTT